MNRVARTRRSALWVTLLGALTLLMVTVGRIDRLPEVGTLEAVFARPAEELEIHQVQEGGTLGEMLSYRLDATEQNRVLMAFREHASPRRIQIGSEVTFRFVDAESRLRGVDVAINADSTVRLTRGDFGWESLVVETPVWVDTVYAAGRIERDLYSSVVQNPALEDVRRAARIALVDELDNIFQWQIDFYRQIRTGDSFRFAFEVHLRPDGSLRRGHVISAELINVGKSFEAIWFDPNDDGRGTYYDREGQSVKRAFLKKPLQFRRISSVFSNSRFHPILQTWRAHRGVDYSAASGTEVMATATGIVSERGNLGSLGNAVVIEHINGFRTRYGHLRAFAADVRVGTRVEQGQVIGYVGETGLATAPHLHYEMWRSGRAVDPLAIDLPAGDPVPSDNLERWQGEAEVRWALLTGLEEQMRFLGGEPRVADVIDRDEGG